MTLIRLSNPQHWLTAFVLLFVIAGCSKSNPDYTSETSASNKSNPDAPALTHKAVPLLPSVPVKVALPAALPNKAVKYDGLLFQCGPVQSAQIQQEMTAYFKALGIEERLVTKTTNADGTLIYTLATPESDTETLSFRNRKEYKVTDEVIRLPAKGGQMRSIKTVSKKEILLTLLQHGRLTEFSGASCAVDALRDHVGVRQNIVAWVEKLTWQWPDGGPAFWNKKYWDKGTPLATVVVDNALMDAFQNQHKYGIGCYTASKISYAHGVLDYYVRVKKDPVKAAIVRERLLHDNDPLVGIEASSMWSFEKDYDKTEPSFPGKILNIKRGVAPNNFVPGDWTYLLNTDAITYEKPGYEGSNAVYLGRDRFDDYYNDNNHHYKFNEKMDEVYQWRNGVFSRRRDFKKIEHLTEADFLRLSHPPKEGGLLEDFRVVPYFFGYETLPTLPVKKS